MKPSKLMHITSVLFGVAGVASFVIAVTGGDDNSVFGITKIDALLCSAILVLIAIWIQVATIHHMILEKHKEVI